MRRALGCVTGNARPQAAMRACPRTASRHESASPAPSTHRQRDVRRAMARSPRTNAIVKTAAPSQNQRSGSWWNQRRPKRKEGSMPGRTGQSFHIPRQWAQATRNCARTKPAKKGSSTASAANPSMAQTEGRALEATGAGSTGARLSDGRDGDIARPASQRAQARAIQKRGAPRSGVSAERRPRDLPAAPIRLSAESRHAGLAGRSSCALQRPCLGLSSAGPGLSCRG